MRTVSRLLVLAPKSQPSYTPLGDMPLSQQVLDHLRKQIVLAELPPHSPIPEAQYAASMGVSRVPVREALMQVQRDGLVYPIYAGFRAQCMVRSFTPDDALQISRIRREIEGLAARTAAVSATDQDIEGMEENIAAFNAASSPEELAHLDVEFHKLLCVAAHQEWILSTWEMIRWPFEAILVNGFRAYVKATSLAESKISTDDHKRILAAIRAREPWEAELLLRQHILRWEEWGSCLLAVSVAAVNSGI